MPPADLSVISIGWSKKRAFTGKKRCHHMFNLCHNSCKCWLIFKLLSPQLSRGLSNKLVITLNVSLHYLVKHNATLQFLYSLQCGPRLFSPPCNFSNVRFIIMPPPLHAAYIDVTLLYIYIYNIDAGHSAYIILRVTAALLLHVSPNINRQHPTVHTDS